MWDNILHKIANRVLRLSSNRYQTDLKSVYSIGMFVLRDKELFDVVLDKMRQVS